MKESGVPVSGTDPRSCCSVDGQATGWRFVRFTALLGFGTGMWPLGHAAVAYLCYSGSTRLRSAEPPGALAVVAVLIGSSFPDLVDKPLSWYLGVLPTGRTLAHSLLVLVPLSLVVFLLARRVGRQEIGVAFGVGALTHALVDAIPALWLGPEPATHLLWPVTTVEPYESSPTILALLRDSLSDPWFFVEFVLAAAALFLWIRDGTPGTELLDSVREYRR